jgi:hypothetical protein
MKPLSFCKPAANEIKFFLRRGNAALGFLLESVQHINHVGKLHGVYSAIGVGIVTVDISITLAPPNPFRGFAAGSVSPIWAV